MAYSKHEIFPTPASDVKIWRYMSFGKLFQLLTSSKLHLTSLDALREYDPHEGRPNRSYYDIHRPINFQSSEADPETGFPRMVIKRASAVEILGEPMAIGLMSKVNQLHTENRSLFFVNCWHMNDKECGLFWKTYCSEEGVAIQSTVGHLIDSIIDEQSIYIANIEYYDSNKETIPLGNSFAPAFYKRDQFKQERELRLLLHKANLGVQSSLQSSEFIKIDLSKLIEKIWISPYAPKYLKGCVDELLRAQNCQIEVATSSILKID